MGGLQAGRTRAPLEKDVTNHPSPRTAFASISQPAWMDPLAFCRFFLFLCFTVSCTFYIRFTLISPLLSFLSYQHACVSAAMRFFLGSQRDVCISLPLSFFFFFSLFFSFNLFNQWSHLHQALDKNIFADVNLVTARPVLFQFSQAQAWIFRFVSEGWLLHSFGGEWG